jgi:hypothetical protein
MTLQEAFTWGPFSQKTLRTGYKTVPFPLIAMLAIRVGEITAKDRPPFPPSQTNFGTRTERMLHLRRNEKEG